MEVTSSLSSLGFEVVSTLGGVYFPQLKMLASLTSFRSVIMKSHELNFSNVGNESHRNSELTSLASEVESGNFDSEAQKLKNHQ